jgi:hypothetical protein
MAVCTRVAVMRLMRARPLGIVVIVVFSLFNAVTFLIAANYVIPGLGESALNNVSELGQAGRITADAIGVLAIVAAIGLWFLSRRAWVLTMVLVGVALVIGLYSWWLGEPNYARLLLNAVMALYLNQAAVREAVGAVPRRLEVAA